MITIMLIMYLQYSAKKTERRMRAEAATTARRPVPRSVNRAA